MKVKIVTVHNSLNPGSFLQATSLYKAVEKLGYTVEFYDAGVRNIWKQACIESLYLCKNKKFKDIGDKFKIARIYTRLLQEYNISKSIEPTDIYILGSDEIWNVARKNMASHPVLWGKGFNLSRTISYAPSINNATEQDLLKYDFVKAALEHLKAVSVRDRHSKECIEKITDRTIYEVCDPTVLAFPEKYQEIENHCICENYILIYIYSKSVSEDEIQAVRDFSKKTGKKLIAFGAAQGWCDFNINGSPDDFLMYIKYADYVCTSTFHGTMLSIIMNKQFAVLGKKNRKVQELMKTVQIERQATKDTLENILLTEYDCAQVNKRLLELRNEGLKFIQSNLEEINNE